MMDKGSLDQKTLKELLRFLIKTEGKVLQCLIKTYKSRKTITY